MFPEGAGEEVEEGDYSRGAHGLGAGGGGGAGAVQEEGEEALAEGVAVGGETFRCEMVSEWVYIWLWRTRRDGEVDIGGLVG